MKLRRNLLLPRKPLLLIKKEMLRRLLLVSPNRFIRLWRRSKNKKKSQRTRSWKKREDKS